MSKEKILALPLVDLCIKPLTLWVKRPERRLAERLRNARGRTCTKPVTPDIKVELSACEKAVDEQPKTVGDLVKKYQYRFVFKWNNGQYRLGLGSKPITELKNKLSELGLTPDDWPALVHHDTLLDHLSKPSILEVPFAEVMPLGRCTEGYLLNYLDCSREAFPSKTIHDFIQIDLLGFEKNKDGSYPYDSGGNLLQRHKRWFVAFHQSLVLKGFGIKDGAFFKWNPKADSLKKAEEALKDCGLSSSNLKLFAKIAVDKRWVI